VVNAVAAVILDYRAYDTLGEITVLFTAIAATMAVICAMDGKTENPKRRDRFE